MVTRNRMAVASASVFQQFVKTEAAGGVLLLASAGAALAAANSPWADTYHRLWTTTVTVAAAGHDLSLTVHQWINDGLMAVFFLLVGLEVKREALAGELSSPRQPRCRLRRRSAEWRCRCLSICWPAAAVSRSAAGRCPWPPTSPSRSGRWRWSRRARPPA
jgi:hypothetical protein